MRSDAALTSTLSLFPRSYCAVTCTRSDNLMLCFRHHIVVRLWHRPRTGDLCMIPIVLGHIFLHHSGRSALGNPAVEPVVALYMTIHIRLCAEDAISYPRSRSEAPDGERRHC